MNLIQWAVFFIFTLYLTVDICMSVGNHCPESCKECTKTENDIVCHCNSSEYFFNGGCVPCTAVGLDCIRCSKASQCEECIPGKWGPQCINKCGRGCKDGKCNHEDGSCTCIRGFHGSDCKMQCSPNCLGNTCLDNGHCNCTTGYYLPTCTAQCYSACEECSNASSCTVCPNGRFGDKCQNECQCSNTIGCDIITGACITRTCPHACISCVNSDHCNECTVGWFGLKCDLECPRNCNGGCFKPSGVCNACSKTYYGSKCDKECYYCGDNDCKQNGECYKCYPGFYGSFCNLTCTYPCTATCNQEDGSCTLNCPANCLSCSDSATCTKCKNLYYGQLCGSLCSPTCKQGKCDIQSGHCVECNSSSYKGDFCNTTCSSICSSNGCERQTGSCIGCLDEKVYGAFCNFTCNTNCKNQICLQGNGYCTNGCISNYYGTTCEKICSENCANSTTESKCYSSGKCISGCVDGFSGDTCISGANTENGKSDVAAIGGGVGGMLVFAVVVVLIIIFLKRRNRKPNEDQSEDIDFECQTIEPLHGDFPGKHVSTKATTAPTLGTLNVNYNHVSDTLMLGGGLETATEDDDLEVDLDEERRSQKRKLAKKVEENVYYIGIQDIEKRKVKVEELAAFVAGKTLDYYEEEFDNFSDGLTRSCDAAKIPQNRAKNRYKGLYAYDATRVKVTGFDTDYINANYIDGFKERNAYIASLGPMSKQMGDFGMFWSMIWQQKVEKIVMVTNLIEEGKEKCEQYWPNVGTTLTYSGVKVTCQSEDEYAEFTRRLLLLNDGESERQLHQLHFTAWPDRGIPEDVTALIEFRHRVFNSPAHLGGPTLVHCSAGIGRTGTYIALDILTKEGNSNNAVEIPGCIINMRQNRPNMVQTAEQYEFLHLALVHTLTFNCEQIPGKQFQDYMIETSKGDLIRQLKKIKDTPHVHTDDEVVAIGRNKSEKGKNRSGADIPGDEYRPRLYLGISNGDSDYVNAVFVHAFQAKRKYIVAQSPMPNTVQDFLNLAYQENCSCIVSFEQSDGKKDIGEYYPADNQELKKGQLTISCGRDKVTNEYNIQKWLTIEFKGSTQSEGGKSTLRHFEFTDWNQTGNVPSSLANYVAFLRDVKMASSNGPVLVHCRDGGSKSGLFCVMAFLLEKLVVEHEVSVVNAVRRVKARRPNAVANQAQFDFCHDCVLEFVRSFKTYSNFSEDI
ncbi:receptor-type tyrosine-protein phosphatase kappa-like isoform X2 [Mya arenaria]|uniref:receptor-type tyrosine-protein phosphatase kappa-like isoform X2 n=1 Tax=Mya arenaria TaxID=6604 RepID=UPI0022E0C94C|nr:receptor-type tyrosine-protein phosphatase kappa-like isoform X2 [Mya arenaria]